MISLVLSFACAHAKPFGDAFISIDRLEMPQALIVEPTKFVFIPAN